jgi:hypothetical protein
VREKAMDFIEASLAQRLLHHHLGSEAFKAKALIQ